jgi:1-pyrroline-5-carboxylate dehydrogenase
MPKRDFSITKPVNENVLSYVPKTKERSELKKMLSEFRDKVLEIPLVIGGRVVKTGDLSECRCPHEHATFWLDITTRVKAT